MSFSVAGKSKDWAPSDINALVEEALNLAYHGARAQDKEFNVTLERDLAKTGKPIEVVPQDVTRVFLNLFGNGSGFMLDGSPFVDATIMTCVSLAKFLPL